MKNILLNNLPLNISVDDKDFDLVNKYKWNSHETTQGYRYASTYINNKLVLMHRLILNPKNTEHVDHIDHNGLNNCRDNLRKVTRSQNMWNRKKHINNKSGYIGVSYDKTNKYWLACISVDGKNKHLGTFMFDIEAAFAYDEAVKKLRDKNATLNFG